MSVCRQPPSNTQVVTNQTIMNETLSYHSNGQASDLDRQIFIEQSVAMVMVMWVWPIVILAGTVGNVLTFLVLIRRRMRRTPCYFYLAMLAFADTSVLYLSGFKTWLRVIAGIEILHLSNASCKIVMFLFLQSLHLSALFIVAITLDRFLTVWLPFNKASICVVRRAKLMSLLSFLIMVAYNIHVFWTINLRKYKKTFICAPLLTNTFMCHVFPWLKLSLYTLVPFFVVFALNVATISKIFHTHARFRRENDYKTSQMKTGQYRVTVMLTGVSISWLMLTAPFTLYSFIRYTHHHTTAHDRAKDFLFKTICFTLLYVNHAINFYIYCLSGKRFRKELKEFISTVRRWSIKSKRTSTYNVKIISAKENQAGGHKIMLNVLEGKEDRVAGV